MQIQAYVHKSYPDQEVRNFHSYPEMKVSTSGLFGKNNFSTLAGFINKEHSGYIYFLDTLDRVHLELNRKIVEIEADDQIRKSSEALSEKENELASKRTDQMERINI